MPDAVLWPGASPHSSSSLLVAYYITSKQVTCHCSLRVVYFHWVNCVPPPYLRDIWQGLKLFWVVTTGGGGGTTGTLWVEAKDTLNFCSAQDSPTPHDKNYLASVVLRVGTLLESTPFPRFWCREDTCVREHTSLPPCPRGCFLPGCRVFIPLGWQGLGSALESVKKKEGEAEAWWFGRFKKLTTLERFRACPVLQIRPCWQVGGGNSPLPGA